jgi:hypothetical protein
MLISALCVFLGAKISRKNRKAFFTRRRAMAMRWRDARCAGVEKMFKSLGAGAGAASKKLPTFAAVTNQQL